MSGVNSDAIWFDGRMVPFAEAQIHVLAHTLHYGVGAFEGIRAYEQPDGRAGVWRLREHIERLLATQRMLRMPTPFDVDTLVEACLATLRANHFSAAYLRPLAFFGMGQMGLGARGNPLHTVIAAWQWGNYLGDSADIGARLRTSSFTRNHPNAALPRAKVVGHYVNSVIARYEAADDGYDEALMLDAQGYVAEGTGENVFIVHRGKVQTPPVMNVLGGITRQTVLEILDLEGIPWEEAQFGRDAVYTAEEAFMSGTAAEITGIRELDRRVIGDGGTGPITRRVKEVYARAVRGLDERLAGYITKA